MSEEKPHDKITPLPPEQCDPKLGSFESGVSRVYHESKAALVLREWCRCYDENVGGNEARSKSGAVLAELAAVTGERNGIKSELEDHTARSLIEVTRLETELAAAQAACAEMRWVLERSRHEHLGHRCSDQWFIERNHALSSDCGKELLDERDRYREALQRIYNYPVHSEPVGGALAMQDFAGEALNPKEKP